MDIAWAYTIQQDPRQARRGSNWEKMEENDLFVNLLNLDAEIRQIRGWLASDRAIANNPLQISAEECT